MKKQWIKYSGTVCVVATILFMTLFVPGILFESVLMLIASGVMLVIGSVSYVTYAVRI